MKAAKQGDYSAQNNIGHFYATGFIINKDDKKAKKWFLQAADNDPFGDSYSNLAQLYFSQYNSKAAIKALKKAAEKNNNKALYDLGLIYIQGKLFKPNIPTSIKYLLDADKLGNIDASYILGTVYMTNTYGMLNYDTSFDYFYKAAQAGHAESQFTIGLYYSLAKGSIKKDYEEAFKFFMQAAKQNHTKAQYYLGQHYRFGLGVEIDLTPAYYWYKKAAENGNKESQEIIYYYNKHGLK